MHGVRSAKICPDKVIGTAQQTIWNPRGGIGRVSGSGPSGWKLRPAKVLARSLAALRVNRVKV